MSLKVIIDKQQAEKVDVRRGNKNGRDWEMRSQHGWVFKPGQQFPIEINFTLHDSIERYPSGEYTLDVDSLIDQGNFKSLVLNTRELILKPAKVS